MGGAMQPAADGPIGEINTTPLIDVMLVLLIVFIITIPVQTHAVRLDLPVGPPPEVSRDPVKNKIVIEASGQLLWNGTPIDRVRLRQFLDVTRTMEPVPELHLQPHPDARYQIVDEVLAIIKRADVQAMGFVGNEVYEKF